MFAQSPIEASLWTLGIKAQTYLAREVFGGFAFLTLAVTLLTYWILKHLKDFSNDEQADLLSRKIICSLLLFATGFTGLRTYSADKFNAKDASSRPWGQHSFVISNPHYKSLKNPSDGLLWYLRIHGVFIQLSKFATDLTSSVFGDPNYNRAPEMMFKMLVNTANVQLDDPSIAILLDKLALQCSDTTSSAILDETTPLSVLFDMADPECRNTYDQLKIQLKGWAKIVKPDYLKKVAAANPGEISERVSKLSRNQALENKLIASTLVNHIKSMSGKNEINTNSKELGISSRWEHIFFNIQRAIAGGSTVSSLAAPFTDKDVDGEIVKNEAGIIYNNLLNLLPSFKGYLKIFISLGFLFAVAGLCLGFIKPIIWWLSTCAMEMCYSPLSALNYQIHSIMVSSSTLEKSFAYVANDPMLLIGAATIDSELAQYQTTYFMVQVVIAAMFVVGVISAGFTVRSMSFAQGASLGAIGSTLMRSRISGNIASTVSLKAGQVGTRVLSGIKGAISQR